MKILVGYQKITSKKGQHFIILHMLEGDVFDGSDGKSWGQLVSSEFVGEDCDMTGDMELGCHVRVFKEEKNGLDRVSMVQFIKRAKTEDFINSGLDDKPTKK